MKILHNKFFIICLCIAVVIAGVSSTFSIMGFRGLAREIVGTVFMPFRLLGTVFVNAFDGFHKYFSSISSLDSQNSALQQENQALREQLRRAELLEAENQRLRQYLSMKSDHPGMNLEEGRVIGRESSNYATVLTLNRGSIHGISNGMPVITEKGIVGCVSEVGLTWCKVSTLIEASRSVGVYLPRSNATGILSGDYSMKNKGLCKLTFIESNLKEGDVTVGDTVYSSGIGSVYPPDLPVGTVVSCEIDSATRTLVATVQPYADFSSPDYMMIVTGYTEAAS